MYASYTAAPPPGYPPAYEYIRTPPVSPTPGGHQYFSPRYSVHTATPSPRGSPKGHSRHASQQEVPPMYNGNYGRDPRMAGYYSGQHSSSRFYPSHHSTPTPRRDSDYVPVYSQAEGTPNRSRARRASHSTAKPPPPKPRPTTAKVTPKATEEDARRAGIPAGYSIKNWDPTEEPIMLLGSVFDANSLGKWIYDWTVFHYGPATPMSEVAGELWLLLIQLAGKVKRAEECMTKIRKKENREMVEDFLESGDRLWMRFAKLLKICEDYMWRAAKKETGKEKPLAMGKNSGCEFVDTIFGRDRELEMTEKLMTGMRLWSMRFDANCEEILRHPAA